MPIRPTGSSTPRQPVTESGDSNLAQPKTGGDSEASVGAAFQDEFVGGIDTTHPQARKALDAYQAKLRNILNHDAESLARGVVPARTGADLSAEQAAAIQDATKELFQNLPLNALSPKMAAKAKGFLERRGVENVDQLGDKPIKDLKPYGSELVKRMAAQFKDAHPGAYYGLAAGLAAGIGYKAYADGSKVLDKLGIKPEFKTSFFDDSLVAKAKASWGKKLTDVHVNSDLEYRTTFGNDTKAKVGLNTTFKGGTLAEMEMTRFETRGSIDRKLGEDLDLSLSASTTGNRYTHGLEVFEHKVGAKLSSKARELKVNTTLDGEGAHKSSSLDLILKPTNRRFELGADVGADGSIEHYRLSGRVKKDNLTLATKSKWDESFELESARLSARYKVKTSGPVSTNALDLGGTLTLGEGGALKKGSADLSLSRGNWNYRGSVNRDFELESLGAELSAGYKKGNLEFHGLGGYNEDRGAYVGAGLTFRF